MKNIEIKTTQNVALQYELADVKDRAFAFAVDLVCLFIGISILSSILDVFTSGEVGEIIVGSIVLLVFLSYSLVMEIANNGQSIGKMVMRIRVIKASGGQATFADYLARWVFRMVDIYFSLGCVASILVSSSARAQRLGDIVANTAVIKLHSRTQLNLADLLSLRSRESYQPVYLNAKNLAESDVLLIKATLDRHRKYTNTAHRMALNQLADRIKQILDVGNVTDNRVFLQNVLNDYVVLTR
jgi:uncharacterized RDD family membrane protein YckC